MQKTAEGFQLFQFFKLLFQVIFNRLHVMLGDGFNFLDTSCVCSAELIEQSFDKGIGLSAEGGKFRHLSLAGQSLKPA